MAATETVAHKITQNKNRKHNKSNPHFICRIMSVTDQFKEEELWNETGVTLGFKHVRDSKKSLSLSLPSYGEKNKTQKRKWRLAN